MKPLMKASVFTKPFPKDSLQALALRVKKMGFQGIEYPFRRGFQVEMEQARERLPALVEAMKAEHLEVTVATADFDQHNSPAVEAFYKAVGDAGIPFIRPAYYPARAGCFWSDSEEARRKLKSLAALSAAYGPKTLLHIHSGSLFTCTCLGTRTLADNCDPQHVGIYFDFAHLALNGEPYEMGLDICGDYLSLVGVKASRYVPLQRDEHGQLRYGVEWVPLAEGMTDWSFAVKLLKQFKYNGPYIFHAEYTVRERTEEFVVEDRKYLAELVDAI